MAWVSLCVFLLLVALAWAGVLTWMMAIHLLRPARMTDGKAIAVLRRLSPEDLGLAYSPMNFTVADAANPGTTLRLAGWWIPAGAPSDGCAIILHGYSDAKVGGIAWAPTWHSLGWNVLALDLRAHGESEGQNSTAGYFEREDLDAVIDSLRQEKPQATTRLALFGVSLGGAVACAVAAGRDDLHAVVVESVFADYLSAIRTHGRRLAMPLEWSHPWAFRLAGWLSGARFGAVGPVDLIPRINAPLMLIHSGGDSFVSPADRDRLDDAFSTRPADSVSERYVIDDAQHTLGLLTDPSAYQHRLAQFLARASVARDRQETRR